MSEAQTWLNDNDEYLSAMVAWIHARLRRLAGEKPPAQTEAPPPPPPPAPATVPPAPPPDQSNWFGRIFRNQPAPTPSVPVPPPAREPEQRSLTVPASDPVLRAAAEWQAAAAMTPPPAALWLQHTLGLSDFELHTLLLCAAVELDTRTAALCAQAQGDPLGTVRAYPTFALGMALFDEPAWDVLSPERPLRYWRLIEITQLAGQPLTISALRGDERIVNLLKGLNYLDDRLTPFVAPLPVPDSPAPGHPADLAASQVDTAAGIVYRIGPSGSASAAVGAAEAPSRRALGRFPLVQLTGPDVEGKALVAAEAARQLGYGLYRLSVSALPSQPGELDQHTRLWQRETALLPVGLYLDAQEASGAAAGEPAAPPIERLLARLEGLVFLASREPWPGLDPNALIVEVERPTPQEQAEAWRAALGAEAGQAPDQLASQFSLGLPAIAGIAARQIALKRADLTGLWEACLERSRPRLDLLAERIDPRSGWDDLVLPEEARRLLQEISAQVGSRATVYDTWGFRNKMSRGLGISALFAGESGVGKTMAAEVIASELRLNLYRIDLSAVVSKYIGETEKNLRRLFDAADGGGAILFFDEADALFGKRSEVKDSHDRYANIEINYLLQRMEAYTGLAILATNMKSALDPAFTRRLRFVVNFPVPGLAERKLIWQKVFPKETPLEADDPALKVDFDRLASVNLTGGSIHNAALNAAFRAARSGSKVSMPILIESIQTEQKKMDRAVTPL